MLQAVLQKMGFFSSRFETEAIVSSVSTLQNFRAATFTFLQHPVPPPFSDGLSRGSAANANTTYLISKHDVV